ncbi:hypothetical protein [Microbispora sp. NPDC049125]|uniref:hypothetical protein n=1 Tax=Microbispora sp. NPDC049125 TaxID=3154929 RepID=UPI0034656756
MPGIDHEMPIDLIHNRPITAVELLRHAAGIEPPAFASARVEAVDCTQLAPVEYRADSVVVLRDAADTPLMALIVEVQQRRDAHKRFSWPVYVTVLRARLKCPTALIVICPDRSVADWSEHTITLGPGGALTPIAVPPGRIPLITDREQARACPELAVLSAIAHGDETETGPVLEAMLAGLETLDRDQATLYLSYVFTVLPSVARKHLEEIVTATSRDYESLAGQYLSHWVDKGRAQGRAEGEAEAILEVLEARGIEISPDTRDRVKRCEDLALLKSWVRRAATVASADEMFA